MGCCKRHSVQCSAVFWSRRVLQCRVHGADDGEAAVLTESAHIVVVAER